LYAVAAIMIDIDVASENNTVNCRGFQILTLWLLVVKQTLIWHQLQVTWK